MDPRITRILVIDEEEETREAIKNALVNLGLSEVETASNAKEGLAILGRGPFDLVFIDLCLPDKGALKELISNKNFGTIVMGPPAIESAVEAIRLGALDYVVKPFTKDEFLGKVEKILRLAVERIRGEEESKGFERWSKGVRIQHFILMLTFTILSITGVPLLFPETFKGVFFFEGASTLRGLMHRVAAVGLMALSIWHLLWALFTEDGQKNLRALRPKFPEDLKELWGHILFNLGLRKTRPPAGRYNFFEKFEYFGVIWGTFAMVLSGLILWFSDAVLRVAPLWVIETAEVVHKYEAILAILTIGIWHTYQVHLRPGKFPMSRVWIDGRISRKEMIEEHPLEYEELTRRKVTFETDEESRQ